MCKVGEQFEEESDTNVECKISKGTRINIIYDEDRFEPAAI